MKSHTMTSTLIALLATVTLLIFLPISASATTVSSGYSGPNPWGDPECSNTNEEWKSVVSGLSWNSGDILTFTWSFSPDTMMMMNDHAGFKFMDGVTEIIPQTELVDYEAAGGSSIGPITHSVVLTGTGGSSGELLIYAANASDCWGPSNFTVNVSASPISTPSNPYVFIKDVSVYESDGNAVFTISASSPVSGDVVIDYEIVDVTAFNTMDFNAITPNQATISDTMDNTTFMVAITDDNEMWQEKFRVNLTGISSGSAVIGDGVGFGTIKPDGQPPYFMGGTSIYENLPNGTVIAESGLVYAGDDDPEPPDNVIVSYTLNSVTPNTVPAVFAVDGGTGRMTIADNTHLDATANPSFILNMTVEDATGRSTTDDLTIWVMDVTNVAAVEDQLVVDEPAVVPALVHTEMAPGVLANDLTDPAGGALTVSPVQGVMGNVGVATPTDNCGEVTLNANGSYTYTMTMADCTWDSFTYTARDAGLNTDSTWVQITINRLNDAAPVTIDDPDFGTIDVLEGQSISQDRGSGVIMMNDWDDDTWLEYVLVEEVNGSNANVGSEVTLSYGTVTVYADGSYVYQNDGTDPTVVPPAATDTFTYRATDGTNISALPAATVTFTIIPVNDAPVANPQTVGATEDVDMPITLTGSDPVETDAITTYTIETLPANGKLYQTPDGTSRDAEITATGTAVSHACGIVIYVSASNGNGPGHGNFEFTVTDDGTPSAATSPPAEVIVNVTAVNDPPAAVDDHYSNPVFAGEYETDEDGNVEIKGPSDSGQKLMDNDGPDPEGDGYEVGPHLQPAAPAGLPFQLTGRASLPTIRPARPAFRPWIPVRPWKIHLPASLSISPQRRLLQPRPQ